MKHIAIDRGTETDTYQIDTDEGFAEARRALAAHGIRRAWVYVGEGPDSHRNGDTIEAAQYQLQVRLAGVWEFPVAKADATFATTEEAEAAWESLVDSDAAWADREHRIVEV